MSIKTFTFKIQNYYVAFAPSVGAYAYGDCFEEAANELADQIQAEEAARLERKTHADR